jgi:hypothetical protein
MHRVRIGAIGLACVFLVVMLATALLRVAGDPSINSAATANEAAPSEPLAELGVAPRNSDPATPPAPATPAR